MKFDINKQSVKQVMLEGIVIAIWIIAIVSNI